MNGLNNTLAGIRFMFIAGTLGQGGAEKQLYYSLKTLRAAGSEILLVCLTMNEHWQQHIEALGIKVVWVGEKSSPILRIMKIFFIGYKFSPDIIQSQHFFTNIYAVIAARLLGAIEIGAIRNNVKHELACNKFWGKALLYLPRWMCANSDYATSALAEIREKNRLLTLPNTIDLAQFDQHLRESSAISVSRPGLITVITVARLTQAKRLDRVLEVANLLKSEASHVQFVIVGAGPERERLESRLADLGLSSDFVRFLGVRSDIPQILSQSDVFLLTSDDEGFPNVLLEAMAAGLPIITTPAGDSSCVVANCQTGYVVDFSDTRKMAHLVLLLVRDSDLRERMGKKARDDVENSYGLDNLHGLLLKLYACVLGRSLVNRS